MKLNEQIREERVLLNFKAENRDAAIGKLVDAAINGFDREAVLTAILEREALGSTGVGHGVAVPHVRIDAVETPIVVFGRSQNPIDFEALDEEPCSLFFLVLSPAKQGAQELHLQTMARISRLMRNENVREALMTVETPAAVMKAIKANAS